MRGNSAFSGDFPSLSGILDLDKPMKISMLLLAAMICLLFGIAQAEEDDRRLVELPEMMQRHMMANMRDHLAAIYLLRPRIPRSGGAGFCREQGVITQA